MTEHFEVGVIGAGPAGLSVAHPMQAAGKSTVIIEEYLWGGTCPNYGCDPKKVLLAAVEAKERAEWMKGFGLRGHEKIDWHALMAHKNAYTDPVPARKVMNLDETGVAHRYGHAFFVDAHTIDVNGQRITADTWVIATGARPARLTDVPGEAYLFDNEGFLNLADMPDEIALIGSGFIAVEFANIAAAAGAKVHLIAHKHHLLREFDQDLTQDIIRQLEAKGVRIEWDFETVEVTKQSNTEYTVIAADGRTVTVNRAFVAIGRVGNTDRLNLAAAGVELGHNGIKVGKDLRTNVPHIFAVGDVADSPVAKLTSTGAFEARYVAGLLNGTEPAELSYPAVPVMVYGSPKLGTVGMSAEEAARQGYAVEEFDMTNWLEYWRLKEPVAKAKVIFDHEGYIVGATVLSGSADELINYFTVAINTKQDKQAIKHNLYAYPSLGSDMSFYYSGSNDATAFGGHAF